ncbi:MAG: hypothetical protein WDN50_13990 [Bradyrhizobium sp.]
MTITSLTAPAPDLQVANLVLTPSSGLESGDGAVLNWDVQNTGNAAVSGEFYSHVESATSRPIRSSPRAMCPMIRPSPVTARLKPAANGPSNTVLRFRRARPARASFRLR